MGQNSHPHLDPPDEVVAALSGNSNRPGAEVPALNPPGPRLRSNLRELLLDDHSGLGRTGPPSRMITDGAWPACTTVCTRCLAAGPLFPPGNHHRPGLAVARPVYRRVRRRAATRVRSTRRAGLPAGRRTSSAGRSHRARPRSLVYLPSNPRTAWQLVRPPRRAWLRRIAASPLQPNALIVGPTAPTLHFPRGGHTLVAGLYPKGPRSPPYSSQVARAGRAAARRAPSGRAARPG